MVFNPDSKWPVHPRARFSSEDLDIDEAAMADYESLSPEDYERRYGRAVIQLSHGNPEGVDRVLAIDHLHVLASKLGFELVPVERADG